MKNINLLFIGNSFAEDLVMYAPEMGKEKSLKLNIHVLSFGGCSIDQHIDFMRSDNPCYVHSSYDFKHHRWMRGYHIPASQVINAYSWDYICFQQASFLASQSESFKNLNELIDIVKLKTNTNKTKLIWQMTWEYPSYYPHDDFTKIYHNNSLFMYDDIVKNVESFIANNPNFSSIIPSGVAIRYLKEYKPELEIYRDNLHLSYHIGRYILSLLLMKTIFHCEIENLITVPFSIPLMDKQKLIEIANKASKFKF